MANTTNNVINIGLGNFILAKRIIAVVSPISSPMRRLKEEAKQGNRLIDTTQGRKTRSFIITDSNHLILSSVLPETIIDRLERHTMESESLSNSAVGSVSTDGINGSGSIDSINKDNEVD